MATAVSEFKPLLNQSVGYGVVIGVGFFFAFVMLLLTYLQSTFTDMSPRSSEEFTASNSTREYISPGLVCCGIVSAWTWSATLLQSSTAAYTFGVSGPWWYGVGGTIQLAIFGMVAAKVKMNANGAHTFLEIVKVRFGTGPHVLFTFYAFLCIMVVCGSLLLGGAATVNALTGMNIIAACFLLPIGIAVYVIVGGLRATFICDWSHTLILFIIIYIVSHGTSPATGGLSGMYDLLVTAGVESPVVGNQDGSYLTMKSNQGLVFGAATILSGFSGIFCDQGYWQRAIASHPTSTTKAYMLGGLSWFAVPFAFASCLGLAARALLHDPRFPTYPNPLSPSQVSAGLAAPAAAAVVMGKGGAIAVLLVVFMAVTSACSAELIAVSSLFIYKTYFRPFARGPEIVRVSHAFICFWAVWMGCWATILHKAQIDLGWLFYVQGVVLSPAVIPIALTVTWSKLTRAGVLCGALIGAILGMLAWMIGCWKIYGTINVPNLANPYSAVCSGLTGLLFSGLITVGVSLISPANYDFGGTRAIANLDFLSADEESQAPKVRESSHDEAKTSTEKDEPEKEDGVQTTTSPVPSDSPSPVSDSNGEGKNAPANLTVLRKAFKKALWYSSVLTAIVAIIGKCFIHTTGRQETDFPLPMFFSNYVYSEKFWSFWIAISIIWALLSGTFSVILPVWESRAEIGVIVRGCVSILRRRRGTRTAVRV
ncbi:solute symporter family transporter [Crucibulum laeve]|uniref:Solute symporter family transporter n=1 Tax=Crucibulum laeve TaxID=68775 RepID=A0A5C3LXL1_9AGAR|nr:solute symporter family transporter [Crucibulum laeve]